MIDAPACPLVPMLAPLPYITAEYGTTVKFRCSFYHSPIPEADVRWYFSSDKQTCRDKRLLTGEEEGISILADSHLLLIERVTARHEGCYIVTADGVGGLRQERGFLDMRPSENAEEREGKAWTWQTVAPFIGTLGVFVVFLVVVMVVRRGWWSCKKIGDGGYVSTSSTYA